jgi:hypothetical protein
MAGERIGDIRINGKPYSVIVPNSSLRDIVDFAPRAASPGGSILHSMLDLYQPLLQTNWVHGFGYPWYQDPEGYLITEGNVDTRHPGIAMLGTEPTSSDTDANIKEGMTVFDGKVWAWGAGGLRSFNGSSWSDEYTANAVNYAVAAGAYLFYAPDGARIRKVAVTSGTHSDAGLDANSTDYSNLIVFNGYIYATKDDTNRIHLDSNSDLSQLEGTSSDTAAIYAGFAGNEVLGLKAFSQRLYVFREDGVWLLGEDGIARRTLDYVSQRDASNFTSVAIHNGFMVYAVRDSIFQWNGVRESDITPNKISDTFPYTTYGLFDNFIVWGRFLLCSAKTNESPYKVAILAFDGVAWHRMFDVITDGDGDITMMGVDPINNYLWYHVSRPTATTEVTYYIQQQARSELPHAKFSTSAGNALITSRWDMGFRDVTKSMVGLRVEGQNLDAGTYLKIYYALDGGAWVTWGTTVTTDGVVELTNPGGNTSVEFNQIKFKVEFITDDATNSPILDSLTARFIMRPDTRWGWGYQVVLEHEAEMDGYMDDRPVKEILDDLKTARDSKSPITLVDIYGRSYEAYLSSINITAQEEDIIEMGGGTNVKSVASCNFVEVKAN